MHANPHPTLNLREMHKWAHAVPPRAILGAPLNRPRRNDSDPDVSVVRNTTHLRTAETWTRSTSQVGKGSYPSLPFCNLRKEESMSSFTDRCEREDEEDRLALVRKSMTGWTYPEIKPPPKK